MARILVAEDDAGVREVMCRSLRDRGIRYEAVPNGRVALQKLCEATANGDPFDCVLLDVVMPEVDGWQVLHAIKSNPIWSDTKIIVLTGYASSPKDIARVFAYDGVHVEKKGPFIELVSEMVDRMLSQSVA